MKDVTAVLAVLDAGDPRAADQLLPLVYEELRKLAAHRLSHENPGQTLQATALVHEAYLRLVTPPQTSPSPDGKPRDLQWNSRGHFFAAAAEAMRRILVNRAQEKHCLKRGGDRQRLDLDNLAVVDDASPEDVLAIDEALSRLAEESQPCAELVKLRFFAGLTLGEAATSLGLPRRTADRYWAYARARLFELLGGGASPARKIPEKTSECAAHFLHQSGTEYRMQKHGKSS